MATYYVDPNASGADDGSSQTDAWTTLQRAVDGTDGTQPTAGDTVKCKHGTGVDETLSAIIDMDGLTGSLAGGYVKYIGVNSSWVNDGTKYDLDANSAVDHCKEAYAASDYIWFENFIFRNAIQSGVDYDPSTASGNIGDVYINCEFLNNTYDGIQAYRGNKIIIIRCLAAGNGRYGIYIYGAQIVAFCVARDNTQHGFFAPYAGSPIYGCLAFDNGYDGMYMDVQSTLINNVIDSNVDDGVCITDNLCVLIGNRMTNHDETGSIGLDAGSRLCIGGWNYFENNDGANKQNATLYNEILDNGATTDVEDQSDTNQGYTSLTEGSEDYNLRDDATLRRTAIQLDVGQ